MDKALVIYVKDSVVESVKEFTGENLVEVGEFATEYMEELLTQETSVIYAFEFAQDSSTTYKWDNSSLTLLWLHSDEEEFEEEDLEESQELRSYLVTVPYTQYKHIKEIGEASITVWAVSAEEALELASEYDENDFTFDFYDSSEPEEDTIDLDFEEASATEV